MGGGKTTTGQKRVDNAMILEAANAHFDKLMKSGYEADAFRVAQKFGLGKEKQQDAASILSFKKLGGSNQFDGVEVLRAAGMPAESVTSTASMAYRLAMSKKNYSDAVRIVTEFGLNAELAREPSVAILEEIMGELTSAPIKKKIEELKIPEDTVKQAAEKAYEREMKEGESGNALYVALEFGLDEDKRRKAATLTTQKIIREGEIWKLKTRNNSIPADIDTDVITKAVWEQIDYLIQRGDNTSILEIAEVFHLEGPKIRAAALERVAGQSSYQRQDSIEIIKKYKLTPDMVQEKMRGQLAEWLLKQEHDRAIKTAEAFGIDKTWFANLASQMFDELCAEGKYGSAAKLGAACGLAEQLVKSTAEQEVLDDLSNKNSIWKAREIVNDFKLDKEWFKQEAQIFYDKAMKEGRYMDARAVADIGELGVKKIKEAGVKYIQNLAEAGNFEQALSDAEHFDVKNNKEVIRVAEQAFMDAIQRDRPDSALRIATDFKLGTAEAIVIDETSARVPDDAQKPISPRGSEAPMKTAKEPSPDVNTGLSVLKR